MEDLELSPRILGALRKAKLLSLKSVLHLSCSDLTRCTKLSSTEVLHLLKVVSETVYKHQKLTALDLYNGSCPANVAKRALSTGCAILDRFLHGGIHTQGITEITGESAAGKTQLCLQLCLTVQRSCEESGLNGGAVYICTEDVFPSKRLQQMISSFDAQCKSEDAKHLGDNIFVEHVGEKEQLWHCIDQRIPVLLSRGLVKLLVVDSVAALFRSDFEAHETFKRARDLQNFAARLHKLSIQFNIPVVCVNQVTANMNCTSSKDSPFIPALGLAWSSSIHTRLMVRRTPYTLTGPLNEENSHVKRQTGYETPVRSIEVVFAPHLPKKTMYYVVDSEGVKGLR